MIVFHILPNISLNTYTPRFLTWGRGEICLVRGQSAFLINNDIFCQQLMIFYHSRHVDEPTGTMESIAVVLGSGVMLQIVSKQKFGMKRP